MIEINFKLFYLFKRFIKKHGCTLPEDDQQETIETCRSSSVVI
jgi:hypothetical protein